MKDTFPLGFKRIVTTLATAVLALLLKAEAPSNGATGNSAWLPNAYNRLEYVSNSGGGYVNTGVVPNGRVPTVHLKYRMNVQVEGKYVFGYWSQADDAGTAVGWHNQQFWLRTWKTSAGYGSWNDEVNVVDLNTPTGTYVNCKLASDAVANLADNGTCEYGLMGRFNATMPEIVSCRLYEARISLDGEMVRDFVPCLRLSDQVAGLYDLVQGKFYRSGNRAPLEPGPSFADDWYQVAPIGCSRWKGAFDGPHPRVCHAATGRVLTEGTDYRSEWHLCQSMPSKALYRVIGLGENEGHDMGVEYEATYAPAAWWQYFTPITKLCSTGGAIIKTGIVPNGAVPEVHLRYLIPQTNDRYPFGYWSNKEQSGTAVGWHDGKFWLRVCKTSAGYGSFDNKSHVVKLNTPTGTYVDDNLASEEIKGFADTSACEYYLMGRAIENDSGVTSAEPILCDLYWAKIWLNGELVRDFVPVRFTAASATVCGLYDHVTGRFFGNALSSGSFTCTDDIQYYQVSPVGASPWLGEKNGPHPEVRLCSTGELLTEGTDYRLEWQLLDDLYAAVCIIGMGEYAGCVQGVIYTPLFGPDNWRRHFREVEYLASDGNGAIIKTGIAPTGSVPVVRLKYRMDELTESKYVFGYWSGKENAGTAVGWHENRFWLRTWKTSAGYGSWNEEKHVVELNTPTGTYVDGKFASGEIKGLADESVCEYYLMGRSYTDDRGSAVRAEPCACRLYSAKIWLDGKIVRDFVPVRTRKSSIYGLYDQVTGQFFRNAADTGAFTGGPDIKVSGLCVIIY